MNNNDELIKKLKSLGIIPVISIDDSRDSIPLAEALIEGGLPCAEITFRTEAAKDSISMITKQMPSLLVGAGTILNIEQVKIAFDAGAKFIVSPGINLKVVKYCTENNIPIIPGIATPTELELAIELGLDTVKFFPAEGNGGLEYLKAISAPYNKMKFIPTGGITEKNLLTYLAFDKVTACGGSWMVKKEMISNKLFDEIKMKTKEAVQLMLGFTIEHIGINSVNENDALTNAQKVSEYFNFTIKNGNSSIFAGTQIEFIKQVYLGKHGHIAVGTNFIDRALAYLERLGIEINSNTIKEKNGKIISVYLKEEIGGFAFHLLQK